MDAIILAGGKGTRMESEFPKALVVAKGKTIISHQIDYFLKYPKTGKIILAIGYKSHQVIKYVKEEYPLNKIEFSIESSPLGTAGAIKNALKLSNEEKIVVLNCDDITDIDLSRLESLKENTVCGAHPRMDFGRIIEKNGYVVFEEKPQTSDWVSCGWYLFIRKDIMNVLPDKGSIEYDVFPKIKLRLYKHEGFWQPINTPKQIQEFEKSKIPEALQ